MTRIAAPAFRRFVSKIVNSSPPKRAAVSRGRRQLRIRRLTSTSRSSPRWSGGDRACRGLCHPSFRQDAAAPGAARTDRDTPRGPRGWSAVRPSKCRNLLAGWDAKLPSGGYPLRRNPGKRKGACRSLPPRPGAPIPVRAGLRLGSQALLSFGQWRVGAVRSPSAIARHYRRHETLWQPFSSAIISWLCIPHHCSER